MSYICVSVVLESTNIVYQVCFLLRDSTKSTFVSYALSEVSACRAWVTSFMTGLIAYQVYPFSLTVRLYLLLSCLSCFMLIISFFFCFRRPRTAVPPRVKRNNLLLMAAAWPLAACVGTININNMCTPILPGTYLPVSWYVFCILFAPTYKLWIMGRPACY